ncbi:MULTISPECIES: cobalamin biosynthesis protein [Mycolicibacterium]|uniref:Cobalamin biosynthesis protein CobD n=1 Tax=Mycolicibacterium senegalense TaxID=1796 RepID=A0A378SZL0_9MYCO|nr:MULTISPECIES: cobalamin biosynthesis protein [Mycolicibacterium]MCV7335368.1 cobalamin biosynthesis protein [Mycolicibacterium senegalense]MDR7290678.1 adenosylcobinamide-phosphate synthase [Mycolicibacterium senegalense]QZA22248.1 cobalamin biosynthesis protein [Mycolicibacterium senegalense]CDP89247.1 cobalamin biosynthesis protein [Mycolicibacterium farcinogenes]STZ53969.1 cobalamin biosynthesis protein [Mycolicibacterium senegalense]
MFAPRSLAGAAGIAAGFLADLLLGDPRRGHPVAGFGAGAARLEKLTYSDTRGAGVLHTGLLLGGLAGLGWAAGRGDRVWMTAAATYIALGGTSLNRVGNRMATLLDADDLAGARALLPSLCGRDPAALDVSGLTRATVESLAENTSDAQVAPLFWAAVGGVPGVLVYRGANTLDAMIGHRSPRYRYFGWAAARFDDALNYLPARLTGVLTVLCAPVVGGSPAAALRAWRRDASRHPSPNAGVAEASFAGALGVRLGGPTQYAHQLEIRPTLGDGRIPEVDDVARAVRLSRAVQAAAAAVAVLLTVSGACRSGRRSFLRR